MPVVLPEEEVDAVMAAGAARIDLERRVVQVAGRDVSFHIDEQAQHRLLNGLDDIGLTLQQADAIEAFERERERPGPVTTAL